MGGDEVMKLKKIILSFVIAFVASFLISIISTRAFGFSLLKAVIFGVIFALLTFGISFVNKKFLSVDSDSFGSDDYTSSSPASKRTGNSVDITIDDENLTEDDEEAKFAVELNKRELPESDLVNESSVKAESSPPEINSSQASPASPASFDVKEAVPVNEKSETNYSAAGTGPGAESNGEGNSAAEKSQSALVREANLKSNVSDSFIDQLPDFGDLNVSEKSEMNDIAMDTEFAQESSVKFSNDTGSKKSSAEEASKNDASTIASAIRTLLKKEA